MGSCGQCVMQYKGEAKDETSLSVRVGNQGVGVNFTLIPAGEQLLGNAHAHRRLSAASAAVLHAALRDSVTDSERKGLL